MKNYFSTITEDTVIIPELVIETVAGEVVHEQTKDLTDEKRKQYLLNKRDDLEKMLLTQLKAVYNNSKKFRTDLAKNRGIDTLRMFLRHWSGYWSENGRWSVSIPFDEAIEHFYKIAKRYEEEKYVGRIKRKAEKIKLNKFRDK